MNKLRELLGAAVLGIGGIVFLSFILSFPIKWAWNHTMPELFNLPEIGAVKAWCLMFLGAVFFKAHVNLKCKHD